MSRLKRKLKNPILIVIVIIQLTVRFRKLDSSRPSNCLIDRAQIVVLVLQGFLYLKSRTEVQFSRILMDGRPCPRKGCVCLKHCLNNCCSVQCTVYMETGNQRKSIASIPLDDVRVLRSERLGVRLQWAFIEQPNYTHELGVI